MSWECKNCIHDNKQEEIVSITCPRPPDGFTPFGMCAHYDSEMVSWFFTAHGKPVPTDAEIVAMTRPGGGDVEMEGEAEEEGTEDDGDAVDLSHLLGGNLDEVLAGLSEEEEEEEEAGEEGESNSEGDHDASMAVVADAGAGGSSNEDKE